MRLFKQYERDLRKLCRDLIDEREPEHVNDVVDSIMHDMFGGGSKSLELVLQSIDDNMNFYEIRAVILELKADIDTSFYRRNG